MAGGLERGAQFLVVVYLSVKDDCVVARCVTHGLVSGVGQVNDRKARVAQYRACKMGYPAIVRTSLRRSPDSLFDCFRFEISKPDDTDNSTHNDISIYYSDMANESYTEAFFDEMQDTNLSSARTVVPRVMELVNPRSVVDIGCGEGLWLKAFQEVGVATVQGFDGPWVKKEHLAISSESFTVADLKQLVVLNKQFDLSVCLEVAEHLPDVAADTLVKSLTAAAPVVLFSAAIPLQGGSHHINEQWPSYWAEKFAAEGYVPVDAIRRHVWDDTRVSFFYAQNILLFVNRTYLSAYPELEKEITSGHGRASSLVHSFIYNYYAERWRLVVPFLGKLPPSLLHGTKKILAR